MILSNFDGWEILWDENRKDDLIPYELGTEMAQELLKNKLEVQVNFSNHRVDKEDLQRRLMECYSTIVFVAPLIKKASARLGQDMKLIVTDINGVIISCQAEDVVGYRCPAAELINNNDQLRRLVNMGNIVEVHYDNGLRSQIIPIFDEQGIIQFYWGVSDYKPISPEVSNILYFAAQLLQQRYKYVLMLDEYTSAFINAIPQYVLMLDENARIININDQCMELLKVSNKEFIKGMHIDNLISRASYESSDEKVNEQYLIGIWDEYFPCQISKQPINTSYGTQLELWFIKPNYEALPPAKEDRNTLEIKTDSPFARIIGETPEIAHIKSLAKRVAKSTATVLIQGESGTGKELFAEAIHRESRRKGMFVAINCGAIPAELMQSELFGYEEGAFTGALKRGCPGKFEIADGGTVFLDEIGEMPMDMQVSLLRFLQDKTVIRVGGHSPQKVNVRIIAATNRNLKAEVEKGTFREDLYYRLNVVILKIPPLRERKGDIPLLAEYILKRLCHYEGIPLIKINESDMKKLMRYNWPGNARELENAIERAFILAKDGELYFEDHPATYQQGDRHDSQLLENSKDKVEKEIIENYLKDYAGNISQTAKVLGMTRQTLYRKMEKLEIDRPG